MSTTLEVTHTAESRPPAAALTEDSYEELIAHFSDIVGKSRQFISKLKTMQKGYRVLLKNQSAKKRKPSSSDAPAGFNKPVFVREDLALFLKIDPSEPTTRTNVTKLLTVVFKEKDLQNPCNRREILLDCPAGEPLRIFFPEVLKPDAPRLSFFNLQRHLKPFFTPVPPTTTQPPTTTTADPETEPPTPTTQPLNDSSSSSDIPTSESPVLKKVVRRVVKKI
jgi:chromatin remodeling complex protein RSC6